MSLPSGAVVSPAIPPTSLSALLDFVRLVRDMREAQRAYYKTREAARLIAAKQLETKVDAAAREVHLMATHDVDTEERYHWPAPDPEQVERQPFQAQILAQRQNIYPYSGLNHYPLWTAIYPYNTPTAWSEFWRW
jgi:hypothetical protein